MRQLHEYTTDKLLAEIRRRTTYGGSTFDVPDRYHCATCGMEFKLNEIHMCSGRPSTANDF